MTTKDVNSSSCFRMTNLMLYEIRMLQSELAALREARNFSWVKKGTNVKFIQPVTVRRKREGQNAEWKDVIAGIGGVIVKVDDGDSDLGIAFDYKA